MNSNNQNRASTEYGIILKLYTLLAKVGMWASNLPYMLLTGIIVTGRIFRRMFIITFKSVALFFVLVAKLIMKSSLAMAIKGYIALFKNFWSDNKKYGFSYALSTHMRSVSVAAVNQEKIVRRAITSVSIMAALVFAVAAVSFCLNYTFAFKVQYRSSNIGYVESETVFTSAATTFAEKIAVSAYESLVEEANFTVCLAPKDELVTADEMVNKVAENTPEISTCYGLYVNGDLALVGENKEIFEGSLKKHLDLNTPKNDSAKVDFVSEVEVKSGYFPVALVTPSEEINNIFDNYMLPLSVKVSYEQTYEQPIKHSIKKVSDSNKAVGYSEIMVQGVDGRASVTASVAFVDGVETERTILSSVIINEPVTEILVVGIATTSPPVSSGEPSDPMGGDIKDGATFIWPVAPSSRQYVSAYYGDGRNHKGVDIASPRGTNIYAVSDGVVVLAKWNGNYGNCVIIKHSDGTYQTLYAHCSSLNVSVGDRVVTGQKIAEVGTTGQSTGNHLHFEVIRDGKNVNPGPYLGI